MTIYNVPWHHTKHFTYLNLILKCYALGTIIILF